MGVQKILYVSPLQENYRIFTTQNQCRKLGTKWEKVGKNANDKNERIEECFL